MPQLLSWQAEVAALELASQPESRQILTNAQQLACAADSFAKTAAQFPPVINDQREAAINQVFDRLTAEGTNARAMLVEARDTLTAGSDTAKSINAAIKSLDDFVRYCGAPSGGATTTTKSTNNHPFNVLDYGVAANQIGAAAKELNAGSVTKAMALWLMCCAPAWLPPWKAWKSGSWPVRKIEATKAAFSCPTPPG